MFMLVSGRYERASLLITTNTALGLWVYDDTPGRRPLSTALPFAPAGDVNHDNRADLVFIAADDAAYVVYGQSATGSLSLSGLSPSSGFRLLTPVPGDALVSAIAVGDVNGDGSIDFRACDEALLGGLHDRTTAVVSSAHRRRRPPSWVPSRGTGLISVRRAPWWIAQAARLDRSR